MMTTAQVQAAIIQSAQRYGVPAQVALAVAAQESGYQQYDSTGRVKTGAAGELGIFQLLPATASSLSVDPSDPQQNIDGGMRYLAQLYRQFASWPLVVAAYNCGPGCVSAWLAGSRSLPASTVEYVAAVTGADLSASGTAFASAGQPSSAVAAPGADQAPMYAFDPSLLGSSQSGVSNTAVWIGLGALAVFAAFVLGE